MATQNLKKYAINCPDCGGENFTRGTVLTFGPSGMTEKTGDFICLECNRKLQLDRAVQAVQLEKKRDELRLMQEEMESLSA